MINLRDLQTEVLLSNTKICFYYRFYLEALKNDLVDLIDFEKYLKINLTS